MKKKKPIRIPSISGVPYAARTVASWRDFGPRRPGLWCARNENCRWQRLIRETVKTTLNIFEGIFFLLAVVHAAHPCVFGNFQQILCSLRKRERRKIFAVQGKRSDEQQQKKNNQTSKTCRFQPKTAHIARKVIN